MSATIEIVHPERAFEDRKKENVARLHRRSNSMARSSFDPVPGAVVVGAKHSFH